MIHGPCLISASPLPAVSTISSPSAARRMIDRSTFRSGSSRRHTPPDNEIGCAQCSCCLAVTTPPSPLSPRHPVPQQATMLTLRVATVVPSRTVTVKREPCPLQPLRGVRGAVFNAAPCGTLESSSEATSPSLRNPWRRDPSVTGASRRKLTSSECEAACLECRRHELFPGFDVQ